MEGKGRYVNGHRFCHHVSIALGKSGSDVDVSCTDRQLGGHPLPFRYALLQHLLSTANGGPQLIIATSASLIRLLLKLSVAETCPQDCRDFTLLGRKACILRET